jgi:peptidyl-dipeptidase Dcp
MHRDNNSAQLRYFLISPQYRGIGLGKYLMELFMEFLFEKKYESAYLWTTSELHTAISLYQRNGFKFAEEILTETFGQAVNEQRYNLILNKNSSLELI